jgi:hypothetical protein
MTSAQPLQTRFLSVGLKAILYLLGKARFLWKTDLAIILMNNSEKLLNLPGKLPFFPTRATPEDRVQALVSKLHPVNCSRELIRLGPEGDGGYLVPNDLEGIETCFSPGVSNVAGFESDCAERGMGIFMADASVEKPPVDDPRFRFVPKYIGASTEGKFLSLEDWVRIMTGGSQADLLLQMDIEGYEYETFLSAPSSLLARFRIMVVEFHDLECLFCEPVFTIYRQVFEKILRTHTCLHIHPNNYCSALRVGNLEFPQMAEFTFLRNDRVEAPSFARTFPHPLDRDNTCKASFALPRSFYRAQ